MNLRLLHDRISKRPTSELREVLTECKAILPDGIQLVESIEERQGLGKCIFEMLVIADVLLGNREFYLRCWQYETVKRVPFCTEPLEQFRELIDESTGGPLFEQEPAKKAVLDLLQELLSDDPPPPHPYKLYLAEYCQQHPSVKNPKAAAAKAYWATKLDKNERIKYADENAFVRHFKYYCGK
jgi:hypothetical protein